MVSPSLSCMPADVVVQAVARAVTPPPARTEADLQADIALILLAGGLDLGPDDVVRREVQLADGTRRRIDIQLGHMVIETKNSLTNPTVVRDAEDQLHGYVRSRTAESGQRFAAILTDGRTWKLYALGLDQLLPITTLELTAGPDDADRLLAWLDRVLSTRRAIPAHADEVVARLGNASPSHQLAQAALRELYEASADNREVVLKRELWSKLLRTAFGAAFEDDTELFINHTLLVLTAEAIAHAVIGWDLRSSDLTPHVLASGRAFSDGQVYGVVESDFFDWVLEVPGGPELVRTLAHRVAQFEWSAVEHDILKVLYESVIAPDVRRGLGEYYTPDWLAERMVAEVVTDPLNQSVLDPACGSGTFVFHAVKAYLAAADAAGRSNAEAVTGAAERVRGIDIHPVAVTLARVTYLLALGRERLSAEDHGPVTIPIYLGDSMQWEQRSDVFSTTGRIVVQTAGTGLVEYGQGTLEPFKDELIFPDELLADAHHFDRLVSRLADRAVQSSTSSDAQLVEPVLNDLGIADRHRPVLRQTFSTMRRLHGEGRDHVWGYYVRNLVRPLWFARPQNHADVLIGNPPWLRYSRMTGTMQTRYKKLAKDRGLLTGGLGASARDLSTLFVTRCVELYLRAGGAFAFVMPHGVLTRKPHEGFRSGRWTSSSARVLAAMETPWDLAEVTTGFPNHACVVLGTLATSPEPIPAATLKFSGRLTRPDVAWAVASRRVKVTAGSLAVLSSSSGYSSVYAKRFRQGAIVVPRVLLQVDVGQASPNPLGPGAGRVHVRSHVTPQAKEPWKYVEPLQGNVERRFIFPLLLGESIAPYRVLAPGHTVLPLTQDRIMTPDEVAEPEGLSAWWRHVEAAWEEHRVGAEDAPLLRRMDYHQQLSSQLPMTSSRVVYTKAGNTLAAACVSGPAIIDHKLYWAAVAEPAEASYLVAILNSTTLLDRVRPLQSRGLFGPRDFDKNVFRIAIPAFDPSDAAHMAIADRAQHAASVAAAVDLTGLLWPSARRNIANALAQDGVHDELEDAINALLPSV